MKKQFASFITKPLKCKICPNFAALNNNIKILHISAVFIFGQYRYSSPWKCLLSFQILDYWNLIGWFIFSRIRTFAHEGHRENIPMRPEADLGFSLEGAGFQKNFEIFVDLFLEK